MGLSNFSVNRPITIIMIVLGMVLIGAVSLSGLSLDLLPEMNFPIAIVMTSYQGSAPQEVENMITRPLEETLGSVENVSNISSQSSMGVSIVVVEFETGTDLNFATLQMREKIDQVKGYLPGDATDPMVMKLDLNAMPVLVMGISGDRPLDELEAIAEDTIKPRIERLEGVASVSITGGLTREIQVIVEPEKMAAHGLDISSVVQALQAQNLNLSAGIATRGGQEMSLRVIGEYSDTAQIASTSMRASSGATLRLDDIARIEDTYKDSSGFSRAEDMPCLTFSVQKQSGANTVSVVRETLAALENLKSRLPGDVTVFTVMDQAEYIEFSISNISDSLLKGGLLAMLILFIFLRNVRSTLIIALSMPISVLATFILVYFGGLTLNMMTMGGLALGIGMIVDCSIVVLENIFRLNEGGMDRVEAAKNGAGEVANAIIASILTTVAVFFPLVYVKGLASEIFSDLALTVSFSLISSLMVALTIIPMLASRLLKVKGKEITGGAEEKAPGIGERLYQSTGKWFAALERLYRSLLKLCLRRRIITVIIVLLLIVSVIPLIPSIGMEFLPNMDQGMISVSIELPRGYRLEETDKVVLQVEEIFRQCGDEVDLIYSSVGGGDTGGMMGLGGGSGANQASIYVMLAPVEERTSSTDDIIKYAQDRVVAIPGAEITVSAVSMMGVTSLMSEPVNVTLKGEDLQQLTLIANQIAALVSGVPGAREVGTSFEEGQAELQLAINREKATVYGLSVAQIASSVRASVGGQVATRYRTGSDEIDVRVRTSEGGKKEVTEMENLLLVSPLGFMVPLGEVTEILEVQAPSTITRDNQSRVVSISAQLERGYDLSTVMADVQKTLERNVYLPPGYSISYGGEFELMTDAFSDLALALLMAIVLVYMILAAQFESLLHPFVIMFSLPVAVIGVVLALYFTGTTFSIVTFIGIIMLAGIVVNNAIVLVDYINRLRQRGLERDEAIITAGPIRLRPILMTALTTILAMLPLAFGTGEGAEMQISLAVAVIGGLTVSTFLTLLFVPVVYSLMDELRRKIINTILL